LKEKDNKPPSIVKKTQTVNCYQDTRIHPRL
jgi:hypothetical protein